MTSINPVASQHVSAALAALSGQSSDGGGRRGTPARAAEQYRKKPATAESRSRRFDVIALDAPRGQQVDVTA
jgi:hypothetical protein